MTPLERAARALCEARGLDPYETSWWHKSEQQENNLFIAEDEARAVLTAIREPSEAIRKALRENVPVDGHDWDLIRTETLSDGTVLDAEADCWRAMIDAMLEEG